MTYYFIQNKLTGHVIDVEGASKAAGASLDAYTRKTTDTDNQLWEFVGDPAGSGCFFIKSKLSGNVIDVREASTTDGAGLDAWPQKSSGTENQLWQFVADPAGSGYHFIRSLQTGHVVDIREASTAPGASLDAWPQKTSGTDNQLWKVVDGEFPGPRYTGLSWGPIGTGPAPNSGTVGSDGNECAYQVSLSIEQDGSCTFSGYYQNRGDVWWGTAPPQGFMVAIFVHDTAGKSYAFSYTGEIPSAPQAGSLVTWHTTQVCPVIADNWYAIAQKCSGSVYWWNTYDESVWQVLGQWFSDAAQDLGEALSDVVQVISAGGDGDGGDGGDDGDDGDDYALRIKKLPPLPTLPPKAPTGTAATGKMLTKGLVPTAK